MYVLCVLKLDRKFLNKITSKSINILSLEQIQTFLTLLFFVATKLWRQNGRDNVNQTYEPEMLQNIDAIHHTGDKHFIGVQEEVALQA